MRLMQSFEEDLKLIKIFNDLETKEINFCPLMWLNINNPRITEILDSIFSDNHLDMLPKQIGYFMGHLETKMHAWKLKPETLENMMWCRLFPITFCGFITKDPRNFRKDVYGNTVKRMDKHLISQIITSKAYERYDIERLRKRIRYFLTNWEETKHDHDYSKMILYKQNVEEYISTDYLKLIVNYQWETPEMHEFYGDSLIEENRPKQMVYFFWGCHMTNTRNEDVIKPVLQFIDWIYDCGHDYTQDCRKVRVLSSKLISFEDMEKEDHQGLLHCEEPGLRDIPIEEEVEVS